MNLIHTSPKEINEINNSGMFGDCLFFAAEEYTMTQANTVYVYSIEIEEDQIVSVRDLYDEEIIEDIARVLEIDEDDAERVLDGRDTAWDHGGEGEEDWWVQAKQGECAKKMGFLACESEDEQGVVYIVSMSGKEKELKLEGVKERV